MLGHYKDVVGGGFGEGEVEGREWVGVAGIPTGPSDSPTPTGCLPIQLTSDTIYPELASDPTG